MKIPLTDFFSKVRCKYYPQKRPYQKLETYKKKQQKIPFPLFLLLFENSTQIWDLCFYDGQCELRHKERWSHSHRRREEGQHARELGRRGKKHNPRFPPTQLPYRLWQIYHAPRSMINQMTFPYKKWPTNWHPPLKSFSNSGYTLLLQRLIRRASKNCQSCENKTLTSKKWHPKSTSLLAESNESS